MAQIHSLSVHGAKCFSHALAAGSNSRKAPCSRFPPSIVIHGLACLDFHPNGLPGWQKCRIFPHMQQAHSNWAEWSKIFALVENSKKTAILCRTKKQKAHAQQTTWHTTIKTQTRVLGVDFRERLAKKRRCSNKSQSARQHKHRHALATGRTQQPSQQRSMGNHGLCQKQPAESCSNRYRQTRCGSWRSRKTFSHVRHYRINRLTVSVQGHFQDIEFMAGTWALEEMVRKQLQHFRNGTMASTHMRHMDAQSPWLAPANGGGDRNSNSGTIYTHNADTFTWTMSQTMTNFKASNINYGKPGDVNYSAASMQHRTQHIQQKWWGRKRYPYGRRLFHCKLRQTEKTTPTHTAPFARLRKHVYGNIVCGTAHIAQVDLPNREHQKHNGWGKWTTRKAPIQS